MKVVLFCGGLGTRIREYSESIPKPMIPVGSHPIMWHVMQYYSRYGHRDFVLCLGYKANVIKDYFLHLDSAATHNCVVSQFGKKVEILGEQQKKLDSLSTKVDNVNDHMRKTTRNIKKITG